MPLLSDVVIFLSLIIVLTPNSQFLDCSTIVFNEWHFCFLILSYYDQSLYTGKNVLHFLQFETVCMVNIIIFAFLLW